MSTEVIRMQTLKNDVIVTSPNPSGCLNPNDGFGAKYYSVSWFV